MLYFSFFIYLVLLSLTAKVHPVGNKVSSVSWCTFSSNASQTLLCADVTVLDSSESVLVRNVLLLSLVCRHWCVVREQLTCSSSRPLLCRLIVCNEIAEDNLWAELIDKGSWWEGQKNGRERDVRRWLLESPDDISFNLWESNCICHYVRLEALTLAGRLLLIVGRTDGICMH